MQGLRFNSYPLNTTTGYGNAATQLIETLEREHDEIDIFNNAPNVFNFCKPEHYEFGYKTIGYTPWESTEVPASWIEPMQRVDALWTTAPWLKPVFEAATGRNDVKVFPHGIAKMWQPLRHYKPYHRPFTFVHTGEPSVRKGGDILLDCWQRFFKNDSSVKLIFKCQKFVQARHAKLNPYDCSNIEIIDKNFNQAELWQLYALSDCMVYPSRGEGFGFIPLETICSGLPTIAPMHGIGTFSSNSFWPLLNSKWVDVPEPANMLHPGRWLQHDVEELAAGMFEIIKDYNFNAEHTYISAQELHKRFSWSSVVQKIAEEILTV